MNHTCPYCRSVAVEREGEMCWRCEAKLSRAVEAIGKKVRQMKTKDGCELLVVGNIMNYEIGLN